VQHDPVGLLNVSLDGNARRAIDMKEGDEIDGAAFNALVLAAIAANAPAAKKRPSARA
jgi:hypothetical protein